MDPGWLYSIDYYYEKAVTKIFDSVTTRLLEDPTSRFTHGDLYFFRRWYEQQPSAKQVQVQALIANR